MPHAGEDIKRIVTALALVAGVTCIRPSVADAKKACRPPAPRTHEFALSMLLGQTADFAFADGANEDQGPLIWNVVPLNRVKPKISLRQRTTPARPHTNDFRIDSNRATKLGIYDIGVSVTSMRTKLTSPQTVVHLRILIRVDSVAMNLSPTAPVEMSDSERRSLLTAMPGFPGGDDNAYSVDETKFHYPQRGLTAEKRFELARARNSPGTPTGAELASDVTCK